MNIDPERVAKTLQALKELRRGRRKTRSDRGQYPHLERDIKIVEAYRAPKATLESVSVQFGITRERVRQIVKRQAPDVAFEKSKTHRREIPCIGCGGSRINKRGRLWGGKLCQSCYNRKRYIEKHGEPPPEKPTHCIRCGHIFEGKKGTKHSYHGNGICRRCYAKTPMAKESRKRWRVQHPERVKELVRRAHRRWLEKNPTYMKQYNATHRTRRTPTPRGREYMKEYYRKNRERLSARARERYRIKALHPPLDNK